MPRFVDVLLSIFAVFSCLTAYANKKDDDLVKIQISDTGIKPWNNFHQVETQMLYNSAVHDLPVYVTQDLQLRPGYIKSWEWDFKRKCYILKLDSSRKYHDGRKLKSIDFEFALVKSFITTIIDLDIPALSFIKGVEKLKRGMLFKSGMVDGIKVVNDETIEIYLTSGQSRFLFGISIALPSLAPIDSFEKDLFTFKTTPVGVGPYKISYSDPKTSFIKIERVEEGPSPKYFEMYSEKTGIENGVDIAFGAGLTGMRKAAKEPNSPFIKRIGKIPSSIFFIEFNFENKSAQLLNFRKSVAYAIDKVAKIDDLTGSVSSRPAEQMIPVFSQGYRKLEPTYDVTKAKEFFNSLPQEIKNTQQVLWVHQTPGTPPSPFYLKLRDCLRAIGMKVELEMSNQLEFLPSTRHIAMRVGGRIIDSNPLITFAGYLPKEGIKHAPQKNDAYVEAFEKADNATEPLEQTKYIHTLSDNLRDNAIVVPLDESFDSYYVTKRIQSIGIDEFPWFLDLRLVRLN